MRKPWHIVVICAALVVGTSARAASFLFSARIDRANSLYAVGTTIEGRFGYDPASPPSQIIPDGGLYYSPSTFLEATFGGSSYSTTADALVINDAPDDGDIFGLTGFGSGFILQFGFYDPTRASLNGFGLPTGAFPALAQGPFSGPDPFEGLTVPAGDFAYIDTVRNMWFDATVLSIRPDVSPVPEPTNWLMFIVGFGLVGCAARRFKRSQATA